MEAAPRRLTLYVMAVLAGLDALQIFKTFLTPERQDFFGLWSAGRFACEHPATVGGVYSPPLLNLYQQHLAPDFSGFYPFAYPPHMLLLLWPVGALPYHLAWALWLGLGLGLFGAACWGLLRGLGAWRGVGVALAVLSLASGQNMAIGETGYFTAACLAGGFALLPRRPVLAGLVFGLLSLKPQMAVLLPFALAGLGAWRSLLAASLSALGLVALSCLVFSPGLWSAWLHALPLYQELVGQNARLYGLMTNIGALPLRLGAGAGVSEALQLAASAALALACYLVFRRGAYGLAVAALLTGTQAAAPHALVYDAPAAALAPLLLWAQSGGRLAKPDYALGLGVLFAPVLAVPGLIYAAASLRLAWLARRA